MGARKSGDFNPVRQGLFGLLGAAILLYPLWKNLSPWPEGTYGVLPFVYLGWIALGVGFLLWTRARRPDALGTVGSALAAVEEEAPPTTQVPAHGDSAKVQTGGPGLNLSPASPNPRRPSHPIPLGWLGRLGDDLRVGERAAPVLRLVKWHALTRDARPGSVLPTWALVGRASKGQGLARPPSHRPARRGRTRPPSVATRAAAGAGVSIRAFRARA